METSTDPFAAFAPTIPAPAFPRPTRAYWVAAIRYELSFVRRGERAQKLGQDVCPRWFAAHCDALLTARAELAAIDAEQVAA